MDRRHFLAASGLATSGLASSGLASSFASAASVLAQRGQGTPGLVNFTHDGLNLDPVEYSALLQRLAVERPIEPDNYSLGGDVAALEALFAQRLGKQAALFLPTGTLANLMAVRLLAREDERVLVQAESHLYNDSGDGASVLGGRTLVPLGEGRTLMSLDDVTRAVERTRGGRVERRVGAISIETPVRRRQHTMADLDELDRICDYARNNGIRLHLDGARLFNLPQHSGRSVRDYAARFDTVYVSAWKHFNGASGAILAGDAALIDGLYHTRRMFGGALPQAWPLIAPVALHLATYEQDYAAAWTIADAVFERLQASGGFTIQRLPGGTSRVHMRTDMAAPDAFVQRARDAGIVLAAPPPGVVEFALQVNTSLLRRSADDIAQRLLAARQG